MRSAITIALAVALYLARAEDLAVAAPSIAVSAAAGASELTMDGEGASATHVVKIADATLSTDGAAGLTVRITAGLLTNPGGHTAVPFQVLLVNHGASAPAESAFTTPAAMTLVWSTAAAGTVDKDLYIKYRPAPLQDPGAYTGTIDLDVSDN